MSMKELEAVRAEHNAERELKAAANSDGVATSRTPKAKMLDASVEEAKRPTKKLRFVNIRDAQKAQQRLEEGYVPIAEGDGGRTLGGGLKLMEIPREKYDARVASERQQNALRLNSHKTEMQNVAEGIARELRDRHGIRMNPERILVNEGE